MAYSPIPDTKTAHQVLLQTDNETLVRMSSEPARVAALLRRASAYGVLNQPDAELATLNRAIAEQSTWRTLTQRAQYYHRRGEYKMELADRLQVLKLEPGDARAHDKLGSVYRHLKCWNEALHEYNTYYDAMVESCKETQIYDEIHLHRGICYQGLKQYEKAIHEFDALLQRVRRHRRAQLHKAECLMEMGAKEKGIELLKEIQRHAHKQIDSETCAQAILMLAKEARSRNEHKMAEMYFQSAKVAIGNSRLSATDQERECKKIDGMRGSAVVKSAATTMAKFPYTIPLHSWVFTPPPLLLDKEEGDSSVMTWLPSKLFDDETKTPLLPLVGVPYLQPIQRTGGAITSIPLSRPLMHRGMNAQEVFRWIKRLGPGFDRDATACYNHGYDGKLMYALSKQHDDEAIGVLKAMGVVDAARVLKLIVSIRGAFVEGSC